MRSSLLQVICNFYSVYVYLFVYVYIQKVLCLYRVVFMFYFILYSHVLFGLYLYFSLKKFCKMYLF